jgi:hypothetical protein
MQAKHQSSLFMVAPVNSIVMHGLLGIIVSNISREEISSTSHTKTVYSIRMSLHYLKVFQKFSMCLEHNVKIDTDK